MEELVMRVRIALAAGSPGEPYPGAPNGRIRDVPDRRAIRWYVTTGLVDRPAGMRGRTAVYGPRHLLQVVAVKRLQAQGLSLAEIQAQLAGATDAELAATARIREELLVTDGTVADRGPVRDMWWAVPRSGARLAVDLSPSGWPGSPALPSPGPGVPEDPAPGPADRARGGDDWRTTESAPAMGGVALPGGAILVLPGTPTADDRAAIAAAARPLLDLLAARGLLTPVGRTS